MKRKTLSSFLVLLLAVSVSCQIVFPDDLPPPEGVGEFGDGEDDGSLNTRVGRPGIASSLPNGTPPTAGGAIDRASAPGQGIFFPREEVQPKKGCTTISGKDGFCLPLVQCAVFSSEINQLSQNPCDMTEAQQGVCCERTPPPKSDPTKVIDKPNRPDIPKPNIPLEEFNAAAENALLRMKQKKEFERELVFNNIVPDINTPVFLHAALFDTTNNVVDQAEKASVALDVSVNVAKENNLSTDQVGFGLSEFDTSNTIIGDTCPVEPVCPETKYRTIDGSCNNLKNKDWGQAVTAFQRLLPPNYSDGTNLPRVSVTGGELPSARLVSQQLTINREEDYRSFTLMVMQWGQFLDHDITHTPLSKGSQQNPISCCVNGQLRPQHERHPECFPIEIPENDSFFSNFGRRCMDFVRSLPAIRKACKFGPREQMNQITAFIDASNVYGSNDEIARSLREFNGGRLLVNNHEGRHMLPEHPNALGCASRRPFCFKAGDVRANEQPDLVVMHTVWMRQHNRIAHQLAQLNPGWTDEILFQETRRIVGAQMQHITYNEFLPVVLGREFMTNFGLIPQSSGYTNNYVSAVDATITNAFATAAYRYGHTMVSGRMKGFSRNGAVERDISLSGSQFAPFFLYDEGAIDSMIRGLIRQTSARFDNHFTSEVTNKLFAQNTSFGLDLVALNIQRGRDHGLRSYNDWRKVCHLPTAKTFADFRDVIPLQDIEKLTRVYQHVDDVDLFIGGILERPKRGALVGPTFLCIVGDQFSRLKIGDRFYYENGKFNSKFSAAQLDELRKTSLARILCDNSDNIQHIQPLVFVNAGVTDGRTGLLNGNDIVSCDNFGVIPKVSFTSWRNEPVWS